MFIKKLKREKLTGITLTLLLLTYVCTSSSVYAKTTNTIPAIDFATIAEPDEEELLLEQNLSETDAGNMDVINVVNTNTVNTMIGETKAPLVQCMTQTQASPSALYQEQDLDSFFDHSVFVGDSLTVGFSNFCKGHESMATDTTYFLAKECGSARVAISSNALTTYADVMPVYNGSVQYIEDSISQMSDVEKVFICYGMNDLVSSTPEQYISSMTTLIDRILAKSPQVTIYVISVPCVVETVDSGRLNNSSIQKANSLMQSTCEVQGWGFINLAEYLMDANLAICPEYSSDGYVHENSAAYKIWVKVLRNYAYKDVTL